MADTTKAKKRWKNLRDRYGLSEEAYNQLYKKQKGMCAICGKEEGMAISHDPSGSVLQVDHCHTTDKIRGLLCRDCNVGLGKVKENISILKRMINYINKHNKGRRNG